LLTNDPLPVAVPLVFGVKDKVNDALCPAARVSGNDNPLTLNSELIRLPELMVTLAPVAVRVAGMLLLVPTLTVPKFAELGDTVSCPVAAPVPAKGTVTLEPDFRASVTLPVVAPLLCGLNVIVKVKLCPGLRLIGALSPPIANPVPVTLAREIVRLLALELVSTSDALC